MSCKDCKNIKEVSAESWHVTRPCKGCGRDLRLAPSPGKHGRGFIINKGDKLTIPAKSFSLSLDPLKGNGTLTKHGIEMLTSQLFFPNPGEADTFSEQAQGIERQFDSVVNDYPPLKGLDINKPEDSERIIAIISTHKDRPEYWAWLAGIFSAMRRESTIEGDIEQAVWATAAAERARSMWAYKTNIEKTLLMGYSARRILNFLGVWQSQQKNSDEQFWQDEFKETPFILSLAFGVPVVLLKDQAYVGGMDISRQGANYADYLFTVEGSRQAIIVEIKNPMTRLLQKRPYRKRLYSPSSDLTGAVSQALYYRIELMKGIESKRTDDGSTLGSQLPKCVVVAGNSNEEFKNNPACRESFELYRANQRDVEIITYDELYRKIANLAQLFGLAVEDKASSGNTSAQA